MYIYFKHRAYNTIKYNKIQRGIYTAVSFRSQVDEAHDSRKKKNEIKKLGKGKRLTRNKKYHWVKR